MNDFAPIPTGTSGDATPVGADSLGNAHSAHNPEHAHAEPVSPAIGRYDFVLDRARDLLRNAAYKAPRSKS